MPPKKRKSSPPSTRATPESAKSYTHPEASLASRPEVGTQDSFRAKKAPRTYQYDSSLAPELQWDPPAAKLRERAEELLRIVESSVAKAASGDKEAAESARRAAAELRRIQEPFLNWTGKAERTSFEVPTLPLFVHERLSTQAILDSVSGWKRDQQVDLFGDPRRPIAEQLRAYEHRDKWVNRMILGDSLVVMNSLLQYEGMGGQVQMIYIDPPYGVKFGSNFQPFVRKRDVKHNDDADLSREPETVQAYRDTWELGLHSYLTYLRDRLWLARDLLNETGSVFMQISDENLHHVREVLDEVFGADNFVAVVSIKKTSGLASSFLQSTQDFVVWYARNKAVAKMRPLFTNKRDLAEEDSHYMRDADGRLYTLSDLTGQNNNVASCLYDFEFEGEIFRVPKNRQWKTTRPGLERLVGAGRVERAGSSIRYKRYVDDFSYLRVGDTWHDIGGSVQSRSDPKVYVVQSGTGPIARCVLMCTDPGDLVLDPTCGSGTTAYVAEQWGRRWITVDTSRVPLALARQRLLTATYPWYSLRDDARGPAGGFVYQRKQNASGQEIGGLVPHITLKSIATNEQAQVEVLVDRPEVESAATRVAGAFAVEAVIPTPVDWDGDGISDSGVEPAEEHAAFTDRMLEVLRRSPQIHVGPKETVAFEQVRRPAKAMVLTAEALLKGTSDNVAFIFGPEHGAVSEQLVHQALKEADRKNYSRLYVVGFAIEPNARQLVEQTRDKDHPAADVPAWYVQATPDLVMGSLLKTTRASQLFSICGLPDVDVRRDKSKAKGAEEKWVVHLRGVDTFDPSTMEARSMKGEDVPAWFLDTDYNGRVFRVSQAFFPRTQAWDALERSLRAEFDHSLFEHLAGDTSASFEAGENKQIAVKVIDDRGNELLVVKPLR